MKKIFARAKRAFDFIRYGLLTLRLAGPRIALRNLRHQLYSRTVFLRLTRPLGIPCPPSSSKYVVEHASPEDMAEFFNKVHGETKEGRHQLLVRKWFYEHGFHNCYITRTSDTNEMCTIRWMITSQDIIKIGWENRFPKLKEDEVLLDNVYTLERFRRKGAQHTSIYQLGEILQSQGFRRLISYVAEDNIPSLKAVKKQGNQVFERVLERHVLFHVTRKTIERFDPPIPIPIPQEREESEAE